MINGIINIYKEAGFTSHDVVAKLRGIVKQKKIGHTGTLDPDAVGVLPVCFGNATKLCDMLTDKSKEYRACMLLGETSDTQDASGTILSRTQVNVNEEEVRDAVMSFVGEYDQIPPMYSALKVNGKKLYELARQGVEIERKPRRVEIHHIKIEEINLPRVTFSVGCSKGTYIRTLVDDLGEVLGCGAHVTVLRRTAVADYPTEKMMKWDALQALAEQGDLAQLDQHLLPIDTAVSKLPALQLTAEQSKGIGFGQRVKFANEAKLYGQVRLFSDKNIFLGVALVDDNNVIRPQRLITQSL